MNAPGGPETTGPPPVARTMKLITSPIAKPPFQAGWAPSSSRIQCATSSGLIDRNWLFSAAISQQIAERPDGHSFASKCPRVEKGRSRAAVSVSRHCSRVERYSAAVFGGFFNPAHIKRQHGFN